MTLRLLASAAAGAKTHQCLDRLREVKAAHPLAPAWVIVPDRLQTLAIRRRLAAVGGAIGVHVATFGDLYQMVLLRAGRPVPLADEPVVYRLTRGAIQQVASQGRLKYYAVYVVRPNETLGAVC